MEQGFKNIIELVDTLKTEVNQIENTAQTKPFVKWVGGKRSIVNELLQRIPKQIKNYY